MKIIVDELSPEQMKRIQNYFVKLPKDRAEFRDNRSRIKVNAEIVSYIGPSAIPKVDNYRNVSFELGLYGGTRDGVNGEKIEKSFFRGLGALLGQLLSESRYS